MLFCCYWSVFGSSILDKSRYLCFVYMVASLSKAIRIVKFGSYSAGIFASQGHSIHFVVYAHGRRLCSNWVRHGSTTISYPQCSLTFMREHYLHRSFAYAKSAVGRDVVSVLKLFAYRVVSTISTDIVSSHTKYCRTAYGITR